MFDRFSFSKVDKGAICARDDASMFIREIVQNSTHNLVRFTTLRKIPAGIDRVDLNGTSTSE